MNVKGIIYIMKVFFFIFTMLINFQKIKTGGIGHKFCKECNYMWILKRKTIRGLSITPLYIKYICTLLNPPTDT